MGNLEQQEPRGPRPGPPSLAARGERRRIERRLQEVGVLCQPEVSLQYQTLAKRSVLRGVESGGATKEIGRYVTFCDERGECIPCLQPIDSVAVNGRHAVVVAPALVSVEVFRVRSTYDVLIVRHDIVQPADGRRGRIEPKVLFRGRQGYLPLDLTGDEKNMAGQIVPEFFSKAGEHIDIPPEFGAGSKCWTSPTPETSIAGASSCRAGISNELTNFAGAAAVPSSRVTSFFQQPFFLPTFSPGRSTARPQKMPVAQQP